MNFLEHGICILLAEAASEQANFLTVVAGVSKKQNKQSTFHLISSPSHTAKLHSTRSTRAASWVAVPTANNTLKQAVKAN